MHALAAAQIGNSGLEIADWKQQGVKNSLRAALLVTFASPTGDAPVTIGAK